MPKSVAHIRFPQSMKLFQFCFRILVLRRPSQKINDQHLGELLNFSPSDTSHWKHGKKALKDPDYLDTLAHTLNIDPDILHDLSEGSIELDEAFADFYETEKKPLLPQDTSETSYQLRISKLETLALNIVNQISLKDIPICMNKLIQAFPFIQLLPSDTIKQFASSTRLKPGNYIVRYLKDNIRPHTRLAIVREITSILLTAEREQYNLLPYSKDYLDSEIRALSHAILIPRTALANVIEKVSTRTNLTKALAENFSVPKSVIRQRLASILTEPAIQLH